MGFWGKLASFFLRNRGLIIFVFAFLTVFLAYFATKVSISYEFAKLLPDDDSTLITYKNFKEKFGEDGAVMVMGVEDKSFFQLEKFNDWGALAKEIKS
jgi:predicted RND superfamily exporter protein